MSRALILALCLAAPAWSFQPGATVGTPRGRAAFRPASTSSTSLHAEKKERKRLRDKLKKIFSRNPPFSGPFDEIVRTTFPGAVTNQDLQQKVVDVLADRGYASTNTLLATSLCCDELARNLEKDLVQVYGKNFNLGGLAGFPFAGNTGWGAMNAHIPDDGYCLTVYGPHVGITADGTVGKVERPGIELVDNCCGSAIAASNYVGGITDGTARISVALQQFSDFQQGAVQELILPHGKRLSDAGDDRMKELPYALYDAQEMLMLDIVNAGIAGTKAGLAVLGGIQINTGPETLDYFHPLRFDYMNSKGEVVEDLLPLLKKK